MGTLGSRCWSTEGAGRAAAAEWSQPQESHESEGSESRDTDLGEVVEFGAELPRVDQIVRVREVERPAGLVVPGFVDAARAAVQAKSPSLHCVPD